MVLAKRKSIILAKIVDKTKIVRGKYTFVIKELELTSEEVAEVSEVAKRFQGSRATKRKIEYGILLEALVGILKIMEKANDMTSI